LSPIQSEAILRKGHEIEVMLIRILKNFILTDLILLLATQPSLGQHSCSRNQQLLQELKMKEVTLQASKSWAKMTDTQKIAVLTWVTYPSYIQRFISANKADLSKTLRTGKMTKETKELRRMLLDGKSPLDQSDLRALDLAIALRQISFKLPQGLTLYRAVSDINNFSTYSGDVFTSTSTSKKYVEEFGSKQESHQIFEINISGDSVMGFLPPDFSGETISIGLFLEKEFLGSRANVNAPFAKYFYESSESPFRFKIPERPRWAEFINNDKFDQYAGEFIYLYLQWSSAPQNKMVPTALKNLFNKWLNEPTFHIGDQEHEVVLAPFDPAKIIFESKNRVSIGGSK